MGSNLGDREQTLRSAVAAIAALPMTAVVATSRLHETAPVGPGVQGMYLNACVRVATCLTPRGLLAALLRIEMAHGRDRSSQKRWGPRTLDLDLLLFGDVVMHDESAAPYLTLPHPRMCERLFVLQPLAEVWPDAVVAGKPIHDQIAALRTV
jgi:2-amino-4-hydroxy-6-hydroxymethyldihydropteridine diphosphokinase